MTHLDDAALDAIEQRADAATEGPWERYESRSDGGRTREYYVLAGDRIVVGDVRRSATALFIAHARADIPALLAAVREARAAATDAEQRAEQAEQRAEIAEAVAEMAASDRDEALANEMAADEALARVRELADEWAAGRAPTAAAELRRALDGGQREAT